MDRKRSFFYGLLAIVACSHSVMAAPQGAQVVHGQASFQSTPNQNLTQIHAGHNSIIEYQQFSIGQQETVRFVQPSAQSRVLNRVMSSDPSIINGILQANGQVYLINPFGVTFGNQSVVDVGALFSAAGSMSNADFLAGINRFTDLSGKIENHGTLRGDMIQLLGRSVENFGTISAPDGLITMSVGEEVWLSDNAGKIFVEVSGSAEKITHEGSLDAKRVSLSAGDIYALAIRSSGSITASEITLDGGENGLVEVSGVLDASGDTGGDISILGDRVGLYGATLDASGMHGGGSILVGGDYQGGGDVRTARFTFVDDSSEIRADAGQSGDGGKVIFWADEWTRFDGAVSATGGSESGDGGFVEISGKRSLFFDGQVDLRAPGGLYGTLLFDPVDVIIHDGGAQTDDGSLPDLSHATVGAPATFNISETALEALSANANILIEASNDIELKDLSDNLLALQTDGTGSVVFTAVGDIYVNDYSDVLQTQGGDVTLTADIVDWGDFDLNGGDLSVTASDKIDANTITANEVTLNAAGDITLLDDVTTTGTTIFNADSDNDLSGALSIAGDISTGNSQLEMHGADLSLTGTTNSGTALTEITASNSMGIDLGEASGELTVDNTELSKITAGSLEFITTGTGDIDMDDVAAADTVNIAGTTTLTAGDDVRITGGAGDDSVWTNSLVSNPGDQTTISKNITSNAGSITFNNAVVLTGNKTVTATAVTFNSTVDGDGSARDLTVNSAGTTTFNGQVGMTSPLKKLTTDAPGTTVIATANVVTTDDQTYNDPLTLSGAGLQRLASNDLILFKSSVTKAAGNLELAAATRIEMDQDVTLTAGALTIENTWFSTGNITTGSGIDFEANGTIDGVNQAFDAGTGTLTALDLTKTTAGTLTLDGDTLLDLNGDVDVQLGSLTLNDTTNFAGDLTGVGITIGATNTADGVGNQLIEGGTGTLTVNGAVTKTSAGNLTLRGDTLIDANENVTVNSGNLAIEDAITAAKDLIASGDVTFTGGITLDGVGDQRVDAQGGTLTVPAITKASSDLFLGGGSALDLNGAIETTAGSMTIEDAFTASGDLTAGTNITLTGAGTLDGGGAQRVDAQAGTLTVSALLDKTSNDLTLAGGTAIDLNATVDISGDDLIIEDAFTASGDLLADKNITLTGSGTLDGGGAQRVDAQAGTLLVSSALTKAAGALTLGGSTLVDLNASVAATTGSIIVEDNGNIATNLTAGSGVTLQQDMTFDGAVDQTVEAGTGTLQTQQLIKTGAGNLTLGGDTLVDVNDVIDVQAGNLVVEDALDAEKDITASGTVAFNSTANLAEDLTATGITFTSGMTLDGAVNQILDATTGALQIDVALNKSGAGNLTLRGDTAVDINDAVTVSSGDLLIEDPFTASGDLTASSDMTFSAAGILDALGDQTLTATNDHLIANGSLSKATGNMILAAGQDIDLNGSVTVSTGNFAATADDELFVQGVTATGVTLNAQANATVDGLLSAGGAVLIDADSDGDGNGTVIINGSVVTVNRVLTMEGQHLTLPGTINTGTATTAFNETKADGVRVGAAGGSGVNFSNAVLGQITAGDLQLNSAGNIVADGVLNASTAGIANDVTLNSVAGTVTFSGAASDFAQGLTVTASTGVTISGALDTNGTTTFTTSSNAVAVNAALDTNSSTLTITGPDVEYGAGGTSTSGTAKTTLLGKTNSNIRLVGAAAETNPFDLSNTTLAKITANSLDITLAGTGAFSADGVTAAGTANAGPITLLTGSGSIDFLGAASTFADAVTATTDGLLTVSADLTTGGATVLTADADDSGAGTLTISGNLSTAGNTLALNGANATISGSSDSGAAATTITASAGRHIGLGNAAAGFDLDLTEIDSLTATGLTLLTTGSGDITADGITAASTATISGTTTLSAADEVYFSGSDSIFTNAMTSNPATKTILAKGVTSTGGAVTFNSAAELTADVAVGAGGGADLIFASTVDSDGLGTPRTLTTTTSGAGKTDFQGNIGYTFPLTALNVGKADIRGFRVPTITGTSTIDFLVAETLAQDTTVSATGAITFANTIDSDGTLRDLTLTSNDTVVFNGIVGLSSNYFDALSVTADNTLNLARNMKAQTLSLQGGADGTGDLTFSAGVELLSPTLTLRAGDGAGGGAAASIDASTNTPAFRGLIGGASSPTTVTLRQDAAITDAALPGTGQYGGGVGGLNLTLQSDEGAITLSSGSKVSDANLTLNGTSVVISGPLTPRMLDVTGSTTLSADVTTTNAMDFHSAVTLGASSTLDGSAVTFDATVDSDGTARSLTVNSSGATTFTGDVGGTNRLSNLTTDSAGTSVIAATNVQTVSNLTINDTLTLSAAGAQLLDSQGGTLKIAGAATKATGDLTLTGGSAINLDGDVTTTAGALTIQDAFNAAGDLTAGTNVTLSGAGTLDGGGNQRIDAQAGTLLASGALAKATGNLTLAGGTAVDLNDDVTATAGALTVEDASSVAGDLTAGNTLTLSGAATFDGVGDQSVDAGTGTLTTVALTTTSAGDFTIDGDTAVDINGAVDIQSGSLTVNDVATFSGDVTAIDATLAAATMDGVGNQLIDATTGTLTLNALVTKTAAGNLTIAGDTLIDADGNVNVNSGDLTVQDAVRAAGDLIASGDVTLGGAVTLDGVGTQRLDAQGGTLFLPALTKATGDLILAGGTALDINGAIATTAGGITVEDAFTGSGNFTAGNNVDFQGAATFDGVGNQTVDSGTGTLTTVALTKTSAGDVTLNGDTAIDINGALDIQSGALTVNDAATFAGDVTAIDATLAAATLDGVGNQLVDATTGTLTLGASVTKSSAGDLTIAGDTLIDADGNVTVTSGDLIIQDAITSAADLVASNDISHSGAITLDGVGAQRIDAQAGTLVLPALTKATGDLTLGGGTTLDLNGDITTTAGRLIIEDAFTAAGDFTAGNNVTLSGVGTFDGVGNQAMDAGTGTLTTLAITKTSAGDMTIDGDTAIDINGALDIQSGALTVNDAATFAGDVTAIGASLVGSTFDGVGNQLLDATTGTLTLGAAATKTSAGNLTIAGDTLIDADGNVNVNAGNLIVQDAVTSDADLIASGDVTFSGAITLDSAGAQRIDAQAGTLVLAALTKANGNLTLGGGSALDLNGNVTTTAGGLTLEDAFTAAGDLTAGNNITLSGAGTLDGGGNQIFDAGTGTLSMVALTKTTGGNLTLSGATLVDANGAVDVQSGNLTVSDALDAEADIMASGSATLSAAASLGGDLTAVGATLSGAVTLDGAGNQIVDATTGTLATQAVTKTSAGNLTVGGDTLVDLNGAIDVQSGNLVVSDAVDAEGDVTSSGSTTFSALATLAGDVTAVDATFSGAVTLDGVGNQAIDAGTGTLTSLAITKTSAGDMTIDGDTAIDLNGTVDIQSGALTVNDAATFAGDVTAIGTTLAGSTFDGVGNQLVDATTGTLLLNSTVTKSTAGNLTIAGDTAIDADGSINVSSGNLMLQDATTAEGDLIASGDVSFGSTLALDSAGAQRIDAQTGTLVLPAVTKANGTLTLGGGTALDLNGTVDATAGSLTIEDVFTAAGDLTGGVGVTMSGAATLDGVGNQIIDATTGTLTTNALTKTGAGNLTIGGDTLVDFNGAVDVQAGDLVVGDAVDAEGDISSSGSTIFSAAATLAGDVTAVDATFASSVTLDGVGNQIVDATTGTLATQTVTKTSAGNLTVSGDTLVDLDGAIDVQAGNLVVSDAVDAEGNISSSGSTTFSAAATLAGDVTAVDATFVAAATLDGAGNQIVDATTGTLTTQAVTKTSAGNLTIAGDTLVNLDGAIDVQSGNLVVSDAVDAEGDISSSGSTTFSAVAMLAGDVTAVDATFASSATLDGVGNQVVDATTGTLATQAVTKTGAGNLTVGGDTLIDVDGDVDVQLGSLTVGDAVALAGNTSAVGVTFTSTATLDGVGDQSVDATTGTLMSNAITKTSAGDLTLSGDALVDANGAIDVQAGDLQVTDALDVEGDVTAASVTFSQPATLDGVGAQTLQATAGALTTGSINKTTAGTLNLSSTTTTAIAGGNITSIGNQVYTGDVAIGGDVAVTGADLTFNDEVDGGFALTLSGSGTTQFMDAIGSSTALGQSAGVGLDIQSTGATTFQSTVNTTGLLAQADVAGGVTFQDDVVVGGTTSLNANAIFDGINFTSSGAVQLGNAASDTLLLTGGASTLTTAAANQAIMVAGKIDGANDLTLSAGGGAVNLNGVIGGTTPLDDLQVSGGSVDLNAKLDATNTVDFNALGNMTIGGAIDPTTVTLVAGGNLTVASSVVADSLIDLSAGGNLVTTSGGTLTTLDPGGQINLTAGSLSLGDNVTADVLMQLLSTSGSITQSAGLLTADRITFNATGSVGGATPLQLSTQMLSAVTSGGNLNLNNFSATGATATSLQSALGNITLAQSGGGTLTVEKALTTDANIAITNAGAPLVLNPDLSKGSIEAGGAGSVTLTTTGSGNIYLGDIRVTDGEITVTSAGDIQDAQDDAELDVNTSSHTFTAAGTIGGMSLVGNATDTQGNVEVPVVSTNPPMPPMITMQPPSIGGPVGGQNQLPSYVFAAAEAERNEIVKSAIYGTRLAGYKGKKQDNRLAAMAHGEVTLLRKILYKNDQGESLRNAIGSSYSEYRKAKGHQEFKQYLETLPTGKKILYHVKRIVALNRRLREAYINQFDIAGGGKPEVADLKPEEMSTQEWDALLNR